MADRAETEFRSDGYRIKRERVHRYPAQISGSARRGVFGDFTAPNVISTHSFGCNGADVTCTSLASEELEVVSTARVIAASPEYEELARKVNDLLGL